MAKRKGLSIDEKRERMLKIFHEKKEAFNLKEVEKYSTKQGIVLPTVKDVLMGLISDNLVDSDKIGSANFYWSLPSKTYQTLQIKLTETQEKIAKLEDAKQKLEDDIVQAQKGKQETNERKKNLEKLNELKSIFDKKEKELEVYKRNDPERLKQLKEETEGLKDKANFWTDQIFLLKQYLQNSGSMNDKDLEDGFGIPMDLEEIQ